MGSSLLNALSNYSFLFFTPPPAYHAGAKLGAQAQALPVARRKPSTAQQMLHSFPATESLASHRPVPRTSACATHAAFPRQQSLRPLTNTYQKQLSPSCETPPFSYINQQFCITSHPLKKVTITKSTREVLFLQTDWCQQLRMATTVPLPLPQRRSRRLRGQKPLSLSRRQVEEEWSGASPTPPPPVALSGALPSFFKVVGFFFTCLLSIFI